MIEGLRSSVEKGKALLTYTIETFAEQVCVSEREREGERERGTGKGERASEVWAEESKGASAGGRRRRVFELSGLVCAIDGCHKL